MEKIYGEERWLLAKSNSTENSVKTEQDEDDEEEEEEALSLCDLPIFHQSRKENEENAAPCAAINEAQEDFNFCRSLSQKSEMCAADEVFFQGQILPLRNSVSSEKGSLQLYPTRSISRSESMDHYCSGGLISSRSSSTSSGSSATTTRRKQNPKPPRNLFHSHPSPSPKITRFPNNKKHKINLNATNYTNSARKSSSSSSIWSIFRLGLVTPPPEIAFGDFKTRNPNNSKNFGSRNSTSTNSSGSVKNVKSGEKKKKKKSMADLLGGGGGCKCSVDAVDTVPSRVVVIKRSASESEVRDIGIEEEEEEEEEEEKVMMKLKSPKKMMKKQISHHRTFEWLKQLSIEAGDDEV